MNGIRFHDKVMTPNGEGIVQGLLTKDGKESILVSHKADLFNPKNTQNGEAISKVQSVRMLYAYNPADVSLLVGGAK